MSVPLPFGKQISYAFGMMGWSILTNLISVILVYLYAPPSSSGIPTLITQGAIFGIFNAITLVMAFGRLFDALYDPFIAQLSDKSKNPRGRRTPYMKRAILPSLLFCFLVFYPPVYRESSMNILWLVATLVGFYVSTTTYAIPYNALLPELAPGSQDKVRLATWQSVGYVFGIGIASNTFNLADVLQKSLELPMRISALQVAILIMIVLAGIFLLIPVLAIDERKYSIGKPNSISLRTALRQTLSNKNFQLFIVADMAYFMAITIITSGLVYFVTVLARQKESIGNLLMITMVLVSFLFYPVVNFLVPRTGKKKIVVFSLFFLAVVFFGIYMLGKPDIDPAIQIFMLIALVAVPVASLNILPNAILAEVIEKDTRDTGENKEAFYFAVRYFFVKIAQTFGIAMFTMSLLYGKDEGNDFGIRLNGLVGCGLCFVAGLVFSRFKENKEK
jgi:GPH family glycoside/pentoside/hexuronide:cation symporter